MKIIDEIKLYVKHGKLPIVQDMEDGYCRVIIDANFYPEFVFEVSEGKDKICDLRLQRDCYFTEEDIQNHRIVGQFDLPLVPFAVGQKVKVREDLAEVFDVSDFDTCKKSFIGKIYTIESVDSRSSGLSYDINGYSFRHDWLLPVLETKRTVDDVLAGLSDEDKEIIKERLK